MISEHSTKLIDFAKQLFDKNSLEHGLPLIVKYIKDIIGAERCSIFIYDRDKDELWTTIADGIDRIVVNKDDGIVGYTLKIKKPVIANDTYSHEKFLDDIDKQTGYKTKNIATVPILNSNKEVGGVLELLNKNGGFSDDDLKFMVFFAHYISGFIELTTVYDKNKG